MATIKKKVAPKKAAPKKKAIPVKGAWVPPWAKKAVEEKKTGEKYASKAAMAKHEKGETKKVRMAEGEIPMKRKGGKTSCSSCSCKGKGCMKCGGKKYGDGGKTMKSDTIVKSNNTVKLDTNVKPNTNKQKSTFNIPPMPTPTQASETMQKSRAQRVGFKNGGKKVTSKMRKSGKKC